MCKYRICIYANTAHVHDAVCIEIYNIYHINTYICAYSICADTVYAYMRILHMCMMQKCIIYTIKIHSCVRE